jgi:hypothetical protein
MTAIVYCIQGTQVNLGSHHVTPTRELTAASMAH